MTLVMDVGTVADHNEIPTIEETVSLLTEVIASVIVIVTAQTIIGDDVISHIGETLTRIGDIGVTDVDTDTETF